MPVETKTYRKRRLEIDSPDTAFILEGGMGWLRVEPAPDSGLPRISRQLLRLGHNSLVMGPMAGYPAQLRLFLDLEPGTRLIPVDLDDLYEDDGPLGSSGPRLVNRMASELAMLVNSTIPHPQVEKRLIPGELLVEEEDRKSVV